MQICVVALGKIGLPLAVQFASKGHHVVGVDIAERVVRSVNAGTAPFSGEEGLDELLKQVVTDGKLTATTDAAAAAATAQAVVIVVPLVVDGAGVPDFGPLDSATRAVAAGLRPGTLVVYETTLPVGTTRDRFTPMLAEGSGLAAGRDLFVAFSPERVFAGRVFADLRAYPKLVGGVGPEAGARAVEFYESVLDFDPRPGLARPNGVWDLGSAEASELAKLAETTYRDVNIALANTFARFADQTGLDVLPVIEACNTQPFSHIHQPGIAVGGHCIPVYPQMYLWKDPQAEIVRAARQANSAMPAYAVSLLEAAHGDLHGERVAVLGVAYRGGMKEDAFSGVYGVVDALRSRGAVPLVSDPLYSAEEIRALGLEPLPAGAEVAAAIIQTDHAEYRDLGSADLPGIRTLVDGRRITDPAAWPGVQRRVIGAGDALAGLQS